MITRHKNTRIKDNEELRRFNEAAQDNIIVLVTEYEYDSKNIREFLVTRNPKLATVKVPTDAWANRKEILLLEESKVSEDELVGSICVYTDNDQSIPTSIPWQTYDWHWIDWRVGVVK